MVYSREKDELADAKDYTKDVCDSETNECFKIWIHDSTFNNFG